MLLLAYDAGLVQSIIKTLHDFVKGAKLVGETFGGKKRLWKIADT